MLPVFMGRIHKRQCVRHPRPLRRFGLSLSPKGATYHSPGQRPGVNTESLKSLRPEGARQLKPMPQSLSRFLQTYGVEYDERYVWD
jgi:hypothetical protein